MKFKCNVISVNKINNNGCYVSREVCEEAIKKYNERENAFKDAIGGLYIGCDDTWCDSTNLINLAAKITLIETNDNYLSIEGETIQTIAGKTLETLINSGARLRVAIRGYFNDYDYGENFKNDLEEPTKIVKSMEIISFVAAFNEGQTKSPDFYINEIK